MSCRRYLSQVAEKNCLLVFHEKPGDRYFRANTIKNITKAALKILKERVKYTNWFCSPEKYYGECEMKEILNADNRMKELSEQLDQIKSFNNSNLIAVIEEEISELNDLVKEYEKVKNQWEDVKKAIKENDGFLAFDILSDRIRHEYEGFEFESLDEV